MKSSIVLFHDKESMSNYHNRCPKCDKIQGYEDVDEVDIGVGVQKHIKGYECPDCGYVVCCTYCGEWDGKHYNWCKTLKKV